MTKEQEEMRQDLLEADRIEKNKYDSLKFCMQYSGSEQLAKDLARLHTRVNSYGHEVTLIELVEAMGL